MPTLKVSLLTGRTVEQGKWKELGKLSKKYMENVAVCEMDSNDLKILGLKEGKKVKVKTVFGSVVLKVKKSKRGPHPGIIFIPYGPWASILMNARTDSTGMPPLKGIEAIVEPTDERILTIEDILFTYYRNRKEAMK